MKKIINYTTTLIISLIFSASSLADPVYLTQTASQVPLIGYGVSCTAGGINTENQYVRVYDLPAYGITDNFQVTQVEFAIELSEGPSSSGQQPLNINIYTLSGPLSYANMTLISSTPVTIFDSQSMTTVVFNVNPTLIPAGSVMVVEYTVQDNYDLYGSGRYYPGANNLGQTAPCYIAASSCGINDPATLASIGFPESDYIINVYGEVSQDVPVSNWAVLLAVGIMVIFSGLIIRKRMV